MAENTNTSRRTLLAAGASLGVTAAAAMGSAQAQADPKTFVLVHGSWHGGWCWRRVADRLEKRGHKVFTPTLTGVGERSHLMSKDINLVGASASTATGTWDNRRRPWRALPHREIVISEDSRCLRMGPSRKGVR